MEQDIHLQIYMRSNANFWSWITILRNKRTRTSASQIQTGIQVAKGLTDMEWGAPTESPAFPSPSHRRIAETTPKNGNIIQHYHMAQLRYCKFTLSSKSAFRWIQFVCAPLRGNTKYRCRINAPNRSQDIHAHAIIVRRKGEFASDAS